MASKSRAARYRLILDAEMLGVIHVIVIAQRGSHQQKILDRRVCVNRNRIESDKEARKLAKQAIIADTLKRGLPKLRE